MAFIGRVEEIQQLNLIKELNKSSLIVISGRRRIGKSTLVYEFSKQFKNFYEFQGLAPRLGLNNSSQLKHFAEQCKISFGGAEPLLNNWSEAFAHLEKELLNKKRVLLFLDEISWMGRYDPEFVGKLKIAWDTRFSRIKGLIVVLCGSVSAWIEDNILNERDFIGRISLTLQLKELDLKSSLNFWGEKSKKVSIRDRLNYLSVAGGIPKYLEEFNCSDTLDANIRRLCYSKGGYLFEDFCKIFNDIFENKSEIYKKVIKKVVDRHLTPKELARQLNTAQNGDFSKALRQLELSGFIARDYSFKPSSKKAKLSKLRISDNYLRFYLKYIEPNIKNIESGLSKFASLESLTAWKSISGLQFENLILNRLPEIINMLKIEQEVIISAGPYFQSATTKTKALQIDLLIECKFNNYYICEIKFKNKIGLDVIKEVQDKIAKLSVPKYSSRRPVLIYSGELDDAVSDQDYFDRMVNLDLL